MRDFNAHESRMAFFGLHDGDRRGPRRIRAGSPSEHHETACKHPQRIQLYRKRKHRGSTVAVTREACENANSPAAAPEAGGMTATAVAATPDPEPERRRALTPPQDLQILPAGTLPVPKRSANADALIQFDTRPASSLCPPAGRMQPYACSPATAWRWVKGWKDPLLP